MGDTLFGYTLVLTMANYSSRDPVWNDGLLVSFIIAVPRILHLPIIPRYGFHPSKPYLAVYNLEGVQHYFKALWYGSLFHTLSYLEKIYVATRDLKIGLVYFVILVFESGLIFYCSILQGWVLNISEETTRAVLHYLLIIWFIGSSFMGLLQNWFCWYKVTSKIHFDRYLGDDVLDEEDPMNPKPVNEKSFGEMIFFCVGTMVLNCFSFMMLMYSCCAGVGFIILFTLWLQRNF